MSRIGLLLSLVTGALGAQTTAPAERPFLRFVREVRLAGGPVTAVALGPHGRWIASGGVNGVVKVRDVASLRDVVNLDVCEGAIVQLAMSPREPKLAVLGDDLSVWRLPDGALLARVPSDATAGTATRCTVAWSRDGRRLAHVAPGNRVTVAGAPDFAVVAARRFGNRPVQALAFSPDGERLHVTVEGGETTAWDLARDRLHSILAGDGETACVTLPDGRLVQGRRTGGFRLGDRQVPGLLAVDQLAVSPEGDRLATGAANQRQVELFAADGRPLHTLDSGNRGGVCFALGADGLAATAGSEGHITLWRHGARVARFGGQDAVVDEVAFTGDGATVVARSGRQACAFDVATGSERRRFVADAIATGSRPDEVVVLQDGNVVRFDVRRDLQAAGWEVPRPRSVPGFDFGRDRVFVDVGGTQAAASAGGSAWFLGREETLCVEEFGATVIGASWSNDGAAALAVDRWSYPARADDLLWWHAPGREPRAIDWNEPAIASLDWALDGASLSIAGNAHLVRLRLPAGEELERAPARLNWLRHVSATRVLAHDGFRIMLWQAAPLRLLATQDLRWLGREVGAHLPHERAELEEPRIRGAALGRDLRRVAFATARAALVFDVLD